MSPAAGTEPAYPSTPRRREESPSAGHAAPAHAAEAGHRQTRWQWLISARGELWSAIAAGVLLAAGFALVQAGLGRAGQPLYWVSLALGMFHGGRAAWEALAARKFDIDVLMAVGAALAAWVGAPAEGALLMFLFVLSGALEALAMARTTRAVEALHKLMPTKAMKWDGPRDDPMDHTAANGAPGRWVAVDPQSLIVGDRVKILPGELIPADAVLTVGQ